MCRSYLGLDHPSLVIKRETEGELENIEKKGEKLAKLSVLRG